MENQNGNGRCVLYDDPVDGYPSNYARDGLPHLDRYPGGRRFPRRRPSISNRGFCSAACRELGHAPLHPETENLFDEAMIARKKRGAYLVNTARVKICNRDAVARALESGQLAGYAGDVWFPQPAPKDHPWRSMPHHGMTPHISGSSLSAEARYAAGTREILECWFEGRPIREEYLIVDDGKLAGAGAHSYSAGDARSGSEEAALQGQGVSQQA